MTFQSKARINRGLQTDDHIVVMPVVPITADIISSFPELLVSPISTAAADYAYRIYDEVCIAV